MSSRCQWTDEDWPRLFRVCPLLDWRYSDIWRLIRSLSIPYCVLYDRGYTSLGDASKTRPNPALLVGEGRYRPAYELKDEHLERSSRQEQSK